MVDPWQSAEIQAIRDADLKRAAQEIRDGADPWGTLYDVRVHVPSYLTDRLTAKQVADGLDTLSQTGEVDWEWISGMNEPAYRVE